MCDAALSVVGDSGKVPPGNVAGETKWQTRTVRVKPEIKLTAGKAINVPLGDLIDQVVKGNKVSKGDKVSEAQGEHGGVRERNKGSEIKTATLDQKGKGNTGPAFKGVRVQRGEPREQGGFRRDGQGCTAALESGKEGVGNVFKMGWCRQQGFSKVCKTTAIFLSLLLS
jgi:hypothetical protein